MEILKPLIEKDDLFKLLEVREINHKPHSYMIGPKHIHAAQKYGGMLGKEVLEEVPCAHPGCGLSYDDHTYIRSAFLQLKRNVNQEEVKSVLGTPECIEQMKTLEVDGFTFVETEEKFRFV